MNAKPVELSVVAPGLNEAGNLPELVTRLNDTFVRQHINGEIVIIDDGSSDDTPAVLEGLAMRFPNLRTRRHPVNRGLVEGWRSGLALATGTLVCLIDSDLQYQPEDVGRMYREYHFAHPDIVQGYRSNIGRERGARYYLSRGLNILLNSLFGMRLRDNKSGFIMCRKEVLEDLLQHRMEYWYYQSFLLVAAASRKYSIREIETLFEPRLVGKSFMSDFPLKVVSRVFQDIPKAFVEFRLFPKQDSVIDAVLRRRGEKLDDGSTKTADSAPFKLFMATMPLHKWQITRTSGIYFRELSKSQWISPEGVREIQFEKLKRLLSHSYHHVPYYRELFHRIGFHPNDFRELGDLSKLPLLSKSDVRENLYHGLLSDNHDKSKILKVSTSGSTGEPFVCYADRHQLEIRWATTLRGQEMTPFRFGDRQARLWHQTLGMSPTQVFRERLDAFLSRRLFIPAFEISEHNIEGLLKKLREFRPVLLDGYAESFHLLATHLSGRKLREIGVRAVISSAQTLPDESRAIIEDAFGCRVFDKYGSREFSGLAWECEAHAGHHVVAESYLVEVLVQGRPAQPGEVGEVIVTDLNNYCQPFLRYRLGDMATATDASVRCACGRGLPLLGAIQGRTQATVRTPSGVCIPGTFFSHFFKDYYYLVRQYQVLQGADGSVVLKIVRGDRFHAEQFQALRTHLAEYLGNTPISVEFVEEIPLGPTGKRTAVRSEITFDPQAQDALPQ